MTQQAETRLRRRHTGVNIPLFSLRSTAGWGIGEISDLAPLATWLQRAGLDRIMLLPLGTMQHGQSSPYSATSTLAIDPIYISLDRVEDFERAGGIVALSPDAREALDAARRSDAVQYDLVRLAKDEALGLAFDQFVEQEWEQLTPRASRLAGYVTSQRWWLDDYALFQAISQVNAYAFWREWPEPLRERDAHVLGEMRRQLSREVLRHQYYQWLAEGQWQEARSHARAAGVELFGDLPFVAGGDSPEIWARASEYRLDVSVGTPPDAFSATGQDWGLPMYRWDAIAASDYAWHRLRGKRMAALYDGLRVDHTIGLYRTYGRPREGEPFFTPAGEADQIAQGAAVLRALSECGIKLIAEDLGLVPDFLRISMQELHVPGCKVLRWERDWHADGAPFIEPCTYAPLSAAMTGTHDTEPLSVWWEELTTADRATVLAQQLFTSRHITDPHQPWTSELRDLLLELAFTAGSDDLLLPMQDLFGWRDRVNVPGTVGSHNWTWALPWPVDRMAEIPDAGEREGFLRDLGRRTGRA